MAQKVSNKKAVKRTEVYVGKKEGQGRENPLAVSDVVFRYAKSVN